LNYCDVKIKLNHPGTNDEVLVEIVLPLTHDAWNGRFQAVGGGGFATGIFDIGFGMALTDGYAAASTDGGHDGISNMANLAWALNPDKSVNWDLLQNFATRSLADLVYVGKSVTAQYFGKGPHHSYWNGCSMGGRQGYMMAQKYPGLLDGILAAAPVLSMTYFAMGDYWPQVVMKEGGTWMSNCEFQYFGKMAMEECDLMDGFADNVISNPDECGFDEKTLVGKRVQCDEAEVEITEKMADVVRKIREGPRTPFGAKLWFGLPVGTSTDFLANITVSPEGPRASNPLGISASFIKWLVLKDPSYNISSLTYLDYFALWTQANREYDWILNADNPDLSAFRATGGKFLSWHGINDPVISYENTIQYRKRVEMEMGGSKPTDEFYRLFIAPGVGHCMHGAGPVPTDPLAQLVQWVENGEPPEVLEASTTNAGGDLVTRDVCLYPRKAKYMGIGDPKRASSWSC
ncbi:tannase and feruloyl esterase, partial [Lindgomyces ingoldianus]